MLFSGYVNILASTGCTASIYLTLLKTMSCYWISLKFPKLIFISNLCWLGVIFANVLLFLNLALRWYLSGYFPLSNLYESLLFLDWCLLFTLVFTETKTGTKLLGALLLPITFLVISFASLILPSVMQESNPLVPALQSNWLMMHVSMMIISYATLILGSLLSLLLLALTKFSSESNNSIGGKIQLIENLDIWSYRTIGLGFPFLTIVL